MQGWWIVLLFALIGSCLFVCLGYRRQITGTMQMLLERLDRAIGGELQEVSYEETMDSAII